MGNTIQSVIMGDAVYIGGGHADNAHDSCRVMKLDLQRDRWSKLPQYSAQWFAMTSLKNQLLLVGGCDLKTRKLTNQIVALEAGRWTQHHLCPLMNTARHSSAAVSFNDHIIVAGGRDDKYRCISTVEVLYTKQQNVASRQWYFAESLPNPRSSAKFTLIGSTLYLMGGWDQYGRTKVVHEVNINELIFKTPSTQARLALPPRNENKATSTLWQKTEDTPLNHSAPLNVGGYLLAVGGQDDNYTPSSSVHFYKPDTRRWEKVRDLPTSRYACTCTVLTSEEVMVAGGFSNGKCLATVNFISRKEVKFSI